MPYSGAGDSKLPSNVKKAGAKQRRQWVHVFNGEYATHGDESRAFATANSVLGKSDKGEKDEKSYLYGGDVMDRQVSQSDADYEPLGGLDNKGEACATCRWFVSPDACVLVRGPISPVGYSKFYMQAPAGADDDEPDADDDTNSMPSMGLRESAMDRLAGAVAGKLKSLFSPPHEHDTLESEPWTPNGGFTFFKDVDNRLRFVATVTNNFRDREKELLTAESHREYIAWADSTGKYPELWLWHAGAKSRWGKADWLDYCDGFLVASGTVDEGKENIAASIKQDEENIAVSHGFLARKADDNGLIHKYRMFELSPLPSWAAANEWTGFTITDGSTKEMPFNAAKVAWLRSKGVAAADIAALEAQKQTDAEQLRAMGIEWKDFEPEPAPAAKAEGQPNNVSGTVNPSLGNPSGIHHPHTEQLTHYHYHIDGTYHEHGHSHSDNSVGHDTDGHSAMSGKSLVDHIKAVADANVLLGIKAAPWANKTKPSEYADVPDDQFLDKENWKYPVDSKHVKAAESYFNHDGQREAGGYSESQWAAMGGKLASALGSEYEYSGGKVVKKGDAGTADKGLAALEGKVDVLTKNVGDLIAMMANGGKSTSADPAIISGSTPNPPVQSGASSEPEVDDFVRFFQNEANRMNGGYQASTAPGNLVGKALGDAARKEYEKGTGDDWFSSTVMAPLTQAGVAINGAGQ